MLEIIELVIYSSGILIIVSILAMENKFRYFFKGEPYQSDLKEILKELIKSNKPLSAIELCTLTSLKLFEVELILKDLEKNNYINSEIDYRKSVITYKTK